MAREALNPCSENTMFDAKGPGPLPRPPEPPESTGFAWLLVAACLLAASLVFWVWQFVER